MHDPNSTLPQSFGSLALWRPDWGCRNPSMPSASVRHHIMGVRPSRWTCSPTTPWYATNPRVSCCSRKSQLGQSQTTSVSLVKRAASQHEQSCHRRVCPIDPQGRDPTQDMGGGAHQGPLTLRSSSPNPNNRAWETHPLRPSDLATPTPFFSPSDFATPPLDDAPDESPAPCL